MDIAEKVTKTWNWHGGRTASTFAMDKMLKIGYAQKEKLRNKIFQGEDKLVFSIEASEGLNYVETYSAIRIYLFEQVKKTNSHVWRSLCINASDKFLYNILDNTKISGIRDIPSLVCILGDCLKLTWPERGKLKEQIENTKYSSPKLTKQIIQIGKDNGFNQDVVNDILSKFSVIQSFKPAKSSKAKLVLSIDPIDFITGSLNDYNWTSCTAPDGCHAAMPLGLYMDMFTIIAYIESEKSEYVLFRDFGKPIAGSNKKMRRYIHFNQDYSGLILSKTYPHINPAFDSALIKIFDDMGYPLRMESNIRDLAIKFVDFKCDVIFNDMDAYSNLILVMGDHDSHICIGEEPYCVSCGDCLSGEEDESFVNQGLCLACAADMGLYDDEYDNEYGRENW